MKMANEPDRADRRQPFYFPERGGEVGFVGFAAEKGKGVNP
jgi:hypothetical protein